MAVHPTQGFLFDPHQQRLEQEAGLAQLALSLGAESVAGITDAEISLAVDGKAPTTRDLRHARAAIRNGDDPLGDQFCALRTPMMRRAAGATYTPREIVSAMLAWCEDSTSPKSVVDPGAGSGRFIVAAGRTFKQPRLIGVELDPLGALLARAHLAAAGLAKRAEIRCEDYRSSELPADDGPTLFLGNPPYVRHHCIEPRWKTWLLKTARHMGITPSGLAGLHVHFLLATAKNMKPGDASCFITSSEWLDVNYGRMVREMFLSHMGGTRLVIIEPTAQPFPDATVTAAVSCCQAADRPRSIFVQRAKTADQLDRLNGGRRVRRERFETEQRWSHLTRRPKAVPSGFVELGELCRVHRGQVTGANSVWIADMSRFRLPASFLFRTVTRARELFEAQGELTDPSRLRQVVDLPTDLDEVNADERPFVDTFLEFARSRKTHRGYIARNRKAWWSVGLRKPAPILATYMARRPPAFVVNTGDARHLNIAHGLYPREPLAARLIARLAKYLSATTDVLLGRTYAGGLTKFEPREMERIPVPEPALLQTGAYA